MSYYGEWDLIASEDWKRRDGAEREYFLEGVGIPKSEAACDYDQLRPQTKEALIEACIDAAQDCGREEYQEAANDY